MIYRNSLMAVNHFSILFKCKYCSLEEKKSRKNLTSSALFLNDYAIICREKRFQPHTMYNVFVEMVFLTTFILFAEKVNCETRLSPFLLPHM